MNLAACVMDALAMRDRLKADGLTGPALDAGLEGVLRDTWPKPDADLESPQHARCGTCRGYGLEMRTCPGDSRCGITRKPHAPHEYGTPCWCDLGRRFREKQAPTDVDALALAAKQKKPSRWGR